MRWKHRIPNAIAEFSGKFHKLLFLAPGGKTVFQGTVPQAENYFENLGFEKPEKVNPADFYMDVIGGMCESNQSDIASLPEQWEQYASENNAGAGRSEIASGDSRYPGVRQADVVQPERVSFHGYGEQPILVNDNQGNIYNHSGKYRGRGRRPSWLKFDEIYFA